MKWLRMKTGRIWPAGRSLETPDLQYHVAATDMKALCKKQTTLEAVAYLEFPAPGNKLTLGFPPSPFVAA